MSEADYNQWSTAKPLTATKDRPSWVPDEDRDRLAAYAKYDQIYWNDGRQYALRVLEGELPLYIPNARSIVDITAHYMVKGLELEMQNGTDEDKKFFQDFLDREEFYSRFDTEKTAGVARGDWVFHLTADPNKLEGTRISLNGVDPSSVFPIYHDDIPDKMIGCHIAVQYYLPEEPDKVRVNRLTYRLEEDETTGKKRVSREQAIFEMEPKWYGTQAKLVKQLIKFGYLDDRITALPIYWFKNRTWSGEDFGSSEIRGLETIIQTISQGDTDVSAALALEGLGVYATDGGRPVDDTGAETVWEVAPGRVMEVPTGSYFRRVEGVTSITPATDQIDYLEKKMNKAASLSDVALGEVDAQTAQSGIALAIKFQPTLAKIETRDRHIMGKLKQLFFDWKTWVEVFERKTLSGDIIPTIGDKLPTDRVARVNELNNMIDRQLIPKSYYRSEMEKLGYTFPDDIEAELEKESLEAIERARAAYLATAENGAGNGEGGDESSDEGGGKPSAPGAPEKKNRSNNRKRPNESAGTEAK
jgi:hypothetical protein